MVMCANQKLGGGGVKTYLGRGKQHNAFDKNFRPEGMKCANFFALIPFCFVMEVIYLIKVSR